MRAALAQQLERYRDALVARFGDDLVTLAVFGSQVTGRPATWTSWS